MFISRSFLLLLAGWELLALAGWAVMGWMPTFFKKQFKLDQGATGIAATSFLAVAMFVGKLVGGVWGMHRSMSARCFNARRVGCSFAEF